MDLSESHEKLSTLPKKPTVSDHGSEGVVGEVSTPYEEFPTTPAVPALQPTALKAVQKLYLATPRTAMLMGQEERPMVRMLGREASGCLGSSRKTSRYMLHC
jgi:hypothetical protein